MALAPALLSGKATVVNVSSGMGGPEAERSVEEGVASILWAATIGADGPTGGFFRDGKRLAW